jgi:hypothetical protein
MSMFQHRHTANHNITNLECVMAKFILSSKIAVFLASLIFSQAYADGNYLTQMRSFETQQKNKDNPLRHLHCAEVTITSIDGNRVSMDGIARATKYHVKGDKIVLE